MPFKDLHEKSKTTAKQGHPYVKCQACGKALNSISIGSFWQHVERKNCYPRSALEFWKKEYRREKAEQEASRKRPKEDSEALSEKKLQEIAKAEGSQGGARNAATATMSASGIMAKTTVWSLKRRRSPRGQGRRRRKRKKKEREGVREGGWEVPKQGTNRTEVPQQGSLRTAELFQLRRPRAGKRSLKVPRDSWQRQYSKCQWCGTTCKEEALIWEEGEVVDSDSNLDFLGSLATEVDTVAWATVNSGAATSCLPKEMSQNLDLAVKPVDEKPFTNASGQVHGTCNPWWQLGKKEAHKFQVWDSFGQWMWQSHCCLSPS